MKTTVLLLLVNFMALTFLMAEDTVKEKDKEKKKSYTLKKVKLDPNKRKLHPFNETGYLIDVQTFFDALKPDKKAIKASDRHRSAYLVFVNKKGTYSFLETPENNSLLEIFESGALVDIKGKELKTGSLIEIEKINVSDKTIKFNLENYKKYTQGKKTTLTGVNKCQCSLNVSTFKHSCKLGHLHHLVLADQSIYHYIQPKTSANMKFHGKKVEVEGLLLPGNYISVTKINLAKKDKPKDK